MTMRFGVLGVLLACLLLGSPGARAACEIEDIVDMIEEGAEPAEIRKDCDREVVDAGNCSIYKVVRLADKDGLDADEIREQCSGGGPEGTVMNPGQQLYCCNAYNGVKVCPMGIALPVGSVCTCSAAPGAGVVCY